MRVCARVRVCACVHACVRACVCVCLCVFMCVLRLSGHLLTLGVNYVWLASRPCVDYLLIAACPDWGVRGLQLSAMKHAHGIFTVRAENCMVRGCAHVRVQHVPIVVAICQGKCVAVCLIKNMPCIILHHEVCALRG